jgi:hypothetical protein
MMEELLHFTDFMTPEDQVMNQVGSAVLEMVMELGKQGRKSPLRLLHVAGDGTESLSDFGAGEPMKGGFSDRMFCHRVYFFMPDSRITIALPA